jgi:DNA polymerase-3 subunit alpha
MTKYVPLHVHSQYSMMDGISKPHQIAQRCKEIGVPACALTDHGNVFGAVAHMKALKKHDIKPIIGCELYVCDQHASIKTAENRKLKHLVVLAKNMQGWKQLIKLISVANLPENLYYKPRLSIEQLAEFADGNLIAFSGHLGSHLSHTIFADMNAGTSCSCIEDVKQYTHTDWVKQTTDMACKLRDIFGKGNFFIEVQLVDSERVPAMALLAQGLRYVSKKTGIKTIATPDAHYCWKEDSFDQRIVLANSLNTTLKEVNDKLARGDEVGLKAFFESRQYYIPSYEDMIGFGNTEEELQATIDIADECETYDLSAKPRLPAFPCPDGMSSKDYLQALLDKGWETRKPLIDKVIAKGEYTEEDYKDRLKEEFGVLTTYKLEDYFLIVHDIVRYARQECGQVIGPGRGSASGSLILYLLGCVEVDPLDSSLLFSRFLNEGRFTKDHISLPDVDLDFEIEHRDEIVSYIRQKYGEDKVAQMVTFIRVQGKGALKEVLRAHGTLTFEQMNEITALIPSEQDIADELASMREVNEDGVASIILWALQNKKEALQQWAYIDDSGKIQGPLAKIFEQTIRLEGIIKSVGKHPAGVIIGPQPLHEVCPMVYDKGTNKHVCGFDMGTLEQMGMLKMDILGVACLSKIHNIIKILKCGNDYG